MRPVQPGSDVAMTPELGAGILAALALAGLAISAYFLLIFYRVVRPGAPGVPTFCRLSERTCESVVFTRDGRLFFGLPNSLFGVGYYLLVLFGAAARLLAGRFLGLDLALAGAAATVLVGAYLTWSLLAKLRVPCTLCLTSHAMNALIAVLLLWLRLAAR